MKNLKSSALLFALLVISTMACKKDTKESNDVIQTTTNCLVKSLIGPNSNVYNYVYDKSNKLLSVTIKNGSDVFTTNYSYLNNSVKVGENETYHLNNFGLSDSSVHHFSNGEIHFIYQYNKQNQIVLALGKGMLSGNAVEIVSTYEYTNGNMVKMFNETSSTSNPEISYEYYLDKVNPFKKSTESKTFKNDNMNLMKAQYQDGELAITYTYEFDVEGNVKKKISKYSIGNETVENYTWDCVK